jgi:hypothetical protein
VDERRNEERTEGRDRRERKGRREECKGRRMKRVRFAYQTSHTAG